MSKTALLCADSASLTSPALIGLPGERLDSQDWLQFASGGIEARLALANEGSPDEVWVVSCDDVAPLNLAAALKSDHPEKKVSLVSFVGSGSLFGGCRAAGVEPLFEKAEFMRRFEAHKHADSGASPQGASPRTIKAASVFGQRAQLESMYSDTASEGTGVAGPVVEGEVCEPPSALRFQDSLQPPVLLGEGEVTGSLATSACSSTQVDHPIGMPVANALSALNANVLCVASGAGGSGKSTVSVLSAVLLQRAGLRTLLIDADLRFGDCAQLLGRTQAMSVLDVCEHPDKSVLLEPSEDHPALLCAPDHLEDGETMGIGLQDLVSSLAQSFDAVVVNTGMQWDAEQIQLVTAAQRTLLLVDQRPSSVRSCLRLIDFCTRAGMPLQSFCYALNFASRQSFITSLDVSCALGGPSVFELADGGSDVSELLGAGMPLELLDAGNELVSSIAELLSALVPGAGSLTGRQKARAKRKSRKLGRK